MRAYDNERTYVPTFMFWVIVALLLSILYMCAF